LVRRIGPDESGCQMADVTEPVRNRLGAEQACRVV